MSGLAWVIGPLHCTGHVSGCFGPCLGGYWHILYYFSSRPAVPPRSGAGDGLDKIDNAYWSTGSPRFCANLFPFRRHFLALPSSCGWHGDGFHWRFIPVPTARPSVLSLLFGVPCRLRNLTIERCGNGFRGAASSTHVLPRGIRVSINFPLF